MSNNITDKISTAPLIARDLYVTGHEVDWDKVPGAHAHLLLRSLAKHHFSVLSWALSSKVEIIKIEDQITVFNQSPDPYNEFHRLTIRLKGDKTSVVVTVDDDRTLDFPTRIEGDKIYIYQLNRVDHPLLSFREKVANRLLYWGDLTLFDFASNPFHKERDETELLRNITLVAEIGKLVKKYPDCMTRAPYLFMKRSLDIDIAKRYNSDYKIEIVESAPEYTVEKTTRVEYRAELKAGRDTVTVETLQDTFQRYLDSPLASSQLDDSRMAFRFTPTGTNYEISFLFSGKIKRIKVVPPDGRTPTAEEIIEMSDWANRELAGIVEKASICKKIEETYEPDEPESEIKEVCDL